MQMQWLNIFVIVTLTLLSFLLGLLKLFKSIIHKLEE